MANRKKVCQGVENPSKYQSAIRPREMTIPWRIARMYREFFFRNICGKKRRLRMGMYMRDFGSGNERSLK